MLQMMMLLADGDPAKNALEDALMVRTCPDTTATLCLSKHSMIISSAPPLPTATSCLLLHWCHAITAVLGLDTIRAKPQTLCA
jgi:hypothetical protein